MKINRNWDGMSARTLDDVYYHGYSVHPSRPYDPSDFKRCYNWFILNFKENKEGFKALLNRVAEAHPIWKQTVDHWDELEKLYLEESQNETFFGPAPKLYDLMQKINEDQK